MSGQTVGNYRIVGTLGVGGMGTVFRAEHSLIGRAAAVKLLNPDMTSNRDVVSRFFNEARATSAIKHPGIVEVFDFGYTPDGHAFIVMELLEGEPLVQRIKHRGRLPEAEAALLMRDVCSALSAAHAKGIVHRDLKPDNIFIVPDPELGERTKILDFGIAKLTDIGLASSATKTGSVMGTPTYMSPEQCRGAGTVDHRADLYSIGCMLYEMVAGRPPFVNPGAGELIGSHLFVEPDPLSRHAPVTPELESLVMTLLAKDPANRVQSARELGQYLLAIAQASGAEVRMSAAHLSLPPGSGIQHFTPAHFTPAHFTPAHLTPPPPVVAGPNALTVAATKPTTLSGTASESILKAAPRRRWGVIAATVIVVVGGVGVGSFLALNRSDDNPPATVAPEPTRVATPPPPRPEPVIDAAPAVEPPPVDAAELATETGSGSAVTATKSDKPKHPRPRPKPDKPKPKGELLETDI